MISGIETSRFILKNKWKFNFLDCIEFTILIFKFFAFLPFVFEVKLMTLSDFLHRKTKKVRTRRSEDIFIVSSCSRVEHEIYVQHILCFTEVNSFTSHSATLCRNETFLQHSSFFFRNKMKKFASANEILISFIVSEKNKSIYCK